MQGVSSGLLGLYFELVGIYYELFGQQLFLMIGYIFRRADSEQFSAFESFKSVSIRALVSPASILQ